MQMKKNNNFPSCYLFSEFPSSWIMSHLLLSRAFPHTAVPVFSCRRQHWGPSTFLMNLRTLSSMRLAACSVSIMMTSSTVMAVQTTGAPWRTEVTPGCWGLDHETVMSSKCTQAGPGETHRSRRFHLAFMSSKRSNLPACLCSCLLYFRSGAAFVSISVLKSSTVASVLTEVLTQLDRQVGQTDWHLVVSLQQEIILNTTP